MLKILLNKSLQFAPVYNKRAFSNHLSMALSALDLMGAKPQELQDYFDISAKNLDPTIEFNVEINKKNWKEFIANPEAYTAYYNFFAKEYEKLGRDDFLKIYLDELSDGIAAHLYHPLIRLAYALETDSNKEVIASMAYLAITHLPLHIVSGAPEGNINDIFKHLKPITISEDGEGSLSKLQLISQKKEFAAQLTGLKFSSKSLPDLASLALNTHLSVNNIISIHMMTGTHALRIVLPFVKNKDKMVTAFTQSFAALYVMLECPSINTGGKAANDNDIDTISKQAHAARDAHTIKLSYTCLQEYKTYGDKRYLQAASERLKI